MGFVIILGLSSLFGIASAIVANNKGRHSIGWFFIGFVLGPLGLILSLVVSKDVLEVEQREISKGAMRRCPFCAELIRCQATVCQYCGRESEDVVESYLVVPEKPDVTVVCPKCGYEENFPRMKWDVFSSVKIKCGACGHKFRH